MSVYSPAELQAAHRILTEFKYELRPVVRGYANRTLYVNLSTGQIEARPVTEEMKEKFTGGRGFCLWLLWQAVTEATRWDDPENELCIAGGPIGGITAYPGTGKCTAVTLSPLTKRVVDSNAGGYFGPYLKFAGWDAIEIQGKADQDVVVFVDGSTGKVTIEAAPFESVDTHIIARQLTEIYGHSDAKEMRSISVVSAGQAGDYSPMTGLNVSYYDPKREEIRIKQAARGGCGRVLRDKKIKAIVVKYADLGGDSNGCADLSLIRKAGQRINREITLFDASQNDMRGFGTPYLVEIMNKFDLLPTQNFRFGGDPESYKVAGDVWKGMYDRRGPDGCWYGCTLQCAHAVNGYELKTGPYKGQKVFVDGPEYETLGALASNCSIWDPEAVLELNFYCDTYGLDTISTGNSIAFAMECWEYGVLNAERTTGMDLSWGNWHTAIELIHQMARGEGFGHIVGQGVRFMKQYFVERFGADPGVMKDIGMEVKGMEISEYMTKESLAQQGGYAMASKGAQHDEAWLIFMELVHKQLPTFEAKAEALHYFPLWRTWFSLHGLCKLPWNDIIPESNKTAAEPQKVPEHVENYTWLYEGVTGKQTSIADIIFASERVYNLQRVFNLKNGFGKRDEDYPPYRAMGPVSKLEYESRTERYDKQLREEVGIDPSGMTTEEKMVAVRAYREDRYDKLMDAVYKRRGWTPNGVPTVETLQRLGIDYPDVVELVKRHGG